MDGYEEPYDERLSRTVLLGGRQRRNWNLSKYIFVYILNGRGVRMLSSKVFISGNSQAIRLPKEYQVDDKEMYIQKIGRSIILFPKDDPWEAFERSLTEFTDDFMTDGRNQPEMQVRDGL